MGQDVLPGEKALLQDSGHAALANMLRGLLRNQQVLADAVGVELPFTEGNLMTLINNVHTKDDGIRLPLTLKKTILNEHAFNMAVDEGYIQLADDGHLLWMLGSNTLLAYFLGRLFCGDYSRFSQRKGGCLWQRGEGVFPAAELHRIFGMTTLKNIRLNRSNRILPDYFELVDNLF